MSNVSASRGSNIRALAPWAFLLVFLVVVFLLNICSFFVTDDQFYGLLPMVGENGVRPRVMNWHDVWTATCIDSYRPLVHIPLRAFTGFLGERAFDVANTIMMGLFLLFFHRFARKTWHLTWRSVVFSITLIFLILCKGESYLWGAGSVNYLWAGTATLGFCLLRERLEQEPRMRWTLLPMCIAALYCGGLQESFAIPMCFAVGLYALFHLRELSVSKVLLFGCYGLGALFLVLGAIVRLDHATPFSLVKLGGTLIKMAFALKGVWLLVLLFLFKREKVAFLRRNVFELLVILGNSLMIAYVGFNGERSLWCSNLFALLIVVREFTLPKWGANLCVLGLLCLWGIVISLGLRIYHNSCVFIEGFLASPQGVTIHERVQCGPFARFFHQSIYQWQTLDTHGQAFSEYWGKGPLGPIALTQELYDTLWVQDTFCVPDNRLPIEGEFYTTPTSNAIVMPIREERDWDACTVKVAYHQEPGLMAWLKKEYAMRKRPLIANATHPVKLATPHGDYLLIVKQPVRNAAIERVQIQ